VDIAGRMTELRLHGFYCSQILLSLGLEAQEKSNPDLIRAVSGLAGGLGFSGDTCGALTGGVCLLGLYAGKGMPQEPELPELNLMILDLVDWFWRRYGEPCGSLHCEEILGGDARNRLTICPGIVAETFEQVAELLAANGFDLSTGR
jgi:C_GCAxxG_C_C family probable redox protein